MALTSSRTCPVITQRGDVLRQNVPRHEVPDGVLVATLSLARILGNDIKHRFLGKNRT